MLYPKKLKIRTYGDPILRTETRPIDVPDEALSEFAQRMLDKMYEANGVGIAAPQVGVPIRLIVIDPPVPKALKTDADQEVDESEDESEETRSAEAARILSPGEQLLFPMMPLALVNPEIIQYGEMFSTREEGCLSVPKVYANVTRPTSIMLKATLLNGEEFTVSCGGFLARVIQHEVDHLNKTVFTDRVSETDKTKIASALERIEAKSSLSWLKKKLTKKEG